MIQCASRGTRFLWQPIVNSVRRAWHARTASYWSRSGFCRPMGYRGTVCLKCGRIELRSCDLESLDKTREAIRGLLICLAASVAGMKYNADIPRRVSSSQYAYVFNTIPARVRLESGVFWSRVQPVFIRVLCSIPTPEEQVG